MKDDFVNLATVETIAKALGELNEKVVFVGGAVVSLYANDPVSEMMRPTKDVDISLEIASWGN